MSRKIRSRIYNEQAARIRARLNGWDYVLGLDLGVGSIGLAAVALESTDDGKQVPSRIVFTCSRIFPSSEGAKDRRDFRGMRNANRHKANRLKWVWKTLAEKGLMLPYSTADADNPSELRFELAVRKQSPYDLRLKGLREQLTIPELGYALYHIANHRGSSSVLASEEKEDSKKYAEAREKTIALTKATGKRTFIEILEEFNKDQERKRYRNQGADIKVCAPTPTRDLIENELDELLEAQRQFYPEILDDGYVRCIKEAVLYENPMIVPEPSSCPYFPEEKRLPSTALINEERRLYEALNNVRFSSPDVSDTGEITSYRRNARLSDSQRQACYDYLRAGKDLTEAGIKKLLPELRFANDIKLQGTQKKKTEIKGFRYTDLERSPVFARLSEGEQERLLADWSNAAREKDFRDKLVEGYGFTQDEARLLIDELLPRKASGSYAPCGKRAMSILLPYIRDERLSYQEAVTRAVEEGKLEDRSVKYGYKHLPYYGSVMPETTQALMGKAWHSAYKSRLDTKGFRKPDTDSEEERYGRIANPVVHQTLNELRKLVNEVIDIFGKKPKAIAVETGRELKVGKEKRDQISKDNDARAKANEKIVKDYLKPHEIQHKQYGKYIKRIRIWEDQDHICPYCGQDITVDDILRGNADLDHIFPQSDIPGDPENNLVVGHKHCNEKKKAKQIPYTAFSGTDLWDNVMGNAEEHLPPSKRWRMTCTEERYQEWLKTNGMLSRFKTDNSYISTVAREYLCSLFTEEEVRHGAVRTVRGSETAILRKAWGLQNLTQELADLQSKNPEEQEPAAGKNRADVRHHVIDAIVIAYSTRGNIQMINTMSGRSYDQATIQECLGLPGYFESDEFGHDEQVQEFRKYIRSVLLEETFVSRKTDHSLNGPLLKATSYSLLAHHGNDIIYSTSKKLTGLQSKTLEGTKAKSLDVDLGLVKGIKVPAWASDEDRARVQKMLDHNRHLFDAVEANLPRAEAILAKEKEEAKSNGKKGREVTEEAILKRAMYLTGGKYYVIKNGSASKMFVTREASSSAPGNVFDTDKNARIDLYYDRTGKLRGEIIRKIDAMDRRFKPQYQKDGFERTGSIYGYDIIEVDKTVWDPSQSGAAFLSSFHVPNASTGRTFLVVDTYTKRASNIQVFFDTILSSQIGQNGSYNLESTLKDRNARIVVLSSAGLVKYVFPLLKDR